MTVPQWVSDTVFYQIFPDRFANGAPELDPPNVQPWDSAPTLTGFQGGDLPGVIRRFEYLLDLGISGIYLNPVFLSPSNHRYNTVDYYRIDPKLGDPVVFRSLIDLAHRNGVKVILDGVFNHCGRGFFAFNDLLENEQHSPYRDWFHVHKLPLDAYGPGKAVHYEAWWGFKSLPKFNTANPSVRRYLVDVARHWIEQGADGWRLDVPNEIDDDSFWAELRAAVKTANPEAYLVGEIWDVNPRWVGPGHFDGLMHYPLRQAILDFVAAGSLAPTQFAARVEELFHAYPQEHVFAHYVTLGTHDTERVRTVCGGSPVKVKLAFLALFTSPGAPGIYYGDEIGLEGGKDPDSRRTFPWNSEAWSTELRSFVQRLIRIRREIPALRRGDVRVLMADDRQGVVALARSLQGQSAVVLLNASSASHRVRIDVTSLGWNDGTAMVNALDDGRPAIRAGRLEVTLPPHGGAILYPRDGP